MCPLPPKLSSHPPFQTSYNICLCSVLDCFYPNVIWRLREQFLQILDSWKENYSLGQKKKQTLSLSLLSCTRASSEQGFLSWGLMGSFTLEWTLSLGPSSPFLVSPACQPLSLLPGPVGGIRVGVSSLRAGSWGLCLGDRVRFRVLWDQYR